MVAGSYLLSSMDVALLTFSTSSVERVSRTCFCLAASSRRRSWTTLASFGEASFWKQPVVLRVSPHVPSASRHHHWAPTCPAASSIPVMAPCPLGFPHHQGAETMGYRLELPRQRPRRADI